MLEPAPSHRVPPTAEEMNPGQWWVPEEVGHCSQMDDLPCENGMA
jgi:hypothetical protein